jgi:uncharacterized phage protein (TIGR01671 family)
MRQIKFRVWDKKNKKMVENYLSIHDLGNQMVQVQDGDGMVLECELMQFTGLLDKNGKEIYEGDIIAYRDRKDKLMEGIEVKWTGIMGEQGVYGYGYDITPDKCEIIGNIYSNPDLTK